MAAHTSGVARRIVENRSETVRICLGDMRARRSKAARKQEESLCLVKHPLKLSESEG